MRIERVRVQEFGPLRDVELELAAGTNVVFGPNEAGKTTLLDVILALLFRWERRRGTRLSTVLGDVERFGDPGDAAGRLELRLGGQVLDYPGGPSLLHHFDLEHAGLAGLFCVRSGELELPQTEPGEFWDELKKVLSGLPRGVDTLREKAHGEAGLTPTGQISDAGDPGRKTRLRELRARRRRLEELRQLLPDAAEFEERIARLEEEKQALERARRRRIVELRERRDELIEERRERPEPPDGSRLEEWRELTRERNRLEGELEEGEKELEEDERQLEECREALSGAEREAGAAAERADAAGEADLAVRARDWTRDREELSLSREDVDRVSRGGLAALVLAGGTLAAEWAIGLVPGDIGWAALLAAVLATLGGAAVLWARRARRRLGRLGRKRRELLEEAAGLGLEAEGVEELPAEVRRIEAESHELQRDLARAEQKVRSAEEQVEERERKLRDKRERLEEVNGALSDLAGELDFDSLEEAEEARERWEELDEEVERLESSLAELAGPSPESWKVDPPEEDGEPREWNPSAWSDVEEKLEEARRGYRELQHDFVAAGLSTPEDVLTELRACRREIRAIEVDREAGLLAGEIFGSMDEALEDRMAGALSREGEFSVSGLLRRVTERYASVTRGGEGDLRIRDEEGREFRLENLSRGTRDQVYLALRIGLADAALEAADAGESGFLLLDDAFLTADWERRQRLVDAASALAERGWQVVYLTCDTHLRELFEEAGARPHEL